MHWWDGGAHMGWMAIWWVLGFGLVAALIAALARGTVWQTSGTESPELILGRSLREGRDRPRCLRTDACRPEGIGRSRSDQL
jgi:hypothetical protein